MQPILSVKDLNVGFKTADGNLEASLRLICEAIHAYKSV